MLFTHYKVSHNFRFRETFKNGGSKDVTMTLCHNFSSKLGPTSSKRFELVRTSQNRSDAAGSSLNRSEPVWTQPHAHWEWWYINHYYPKQPKHPLQKRKPGIRRAHGIKQQYLNYTFSDWMENFLPKILNLFVNFFPLRSWLSTCFSRFQHICFLQELARTLNNSARVSEDPQEQTAFNSTSYFQWTMGSYFQKTKLF